MWHSIVERGLDSASSGDLMRIQSQHDTGGNVTATQILTNAFTAARIRLQKKEKNNSKISNE
jgi:hypothetical protein